MISTNSKTPYFLKWSDSTPIEFYLWHEGAIEKIDAGTWALKNSSHTVIVSGSLTVAVDGKSTATISIPGSTQVLAEYYLQFDIVTEGHGSHGAQSLSFRQEAFVCRSLFYPSLSPSDIYEKFPAMSPDHPSSISTYDDANFSKFLEVAWNKIINHLVSTGKRPQMIISHGALCEWHLAETLAHIFEDFATRNNESYMELAKSYKKEAKNLRDNLSIKYEGDVAGRRRKVTNTLWLK